MPPSVRFVDALEVLGRHRVRFIVVGGVAAVLGGAPVSTFDLDIVHDRAADNVDALVAALTELDARYRAPTGRVLRPDPRGLLGPGHHLLLTAAGPLDVLGAIVGDETYASLAPKAETIELAGVAVQILGLAALIESKARLARDKDRATLAILRRTLAERDRGGT